MSRTAPGVGSRFLDPAVLGRISNLELLSRTVVDGFLNGIHKAPYLGLSMDFAQHRPYVPGDDIRHLDWRLFARTDRYYIKQYEAETNTDVVALVDVSKSMDWTGDESRPTKLDYARFLAASLLYMSRKQRDRVGCVTFDHSIIERVPASGRNMELALMALERSEARGPGDLRQSVLEASGGLHKRGLVLLVSDFYEEVEDVVAAIRLLTARKQDVMVFHLLDPAERDLDPGDAMDFLDAETDEQIPVVPNRIRTSYSEIMDAHTTAMERQLVREGVDYVAVDTSQPLDLTLFKYLSLRARSTRRR